MREFTVPITACEVCGLAATHFCTACRKWLCDKSRCNLLSGATAAIVHPVRSARVVFSRVAMRSRL